MLTPDEKAIHERMARVFWRFGDMSHGLAVGDNQAIIAAVVAMLPEFEADPKIIVIAPELLLGAIRCLRSIGPDAADVLTQAEMLQASTGTPTGTKH